MLKPYMGFMAIGPEEGACLVFAHTAREAKKLAYPVVCEGWGAHYTELRIRMLKSEPWLWKLNPNNVKCVIECPPTCRYCGFWGQEMMEGCDVCVKCYDGMTEGTEFSRQK